MIVASLGFFFVTATTFTSLGNVLYTMVRGAGLVAGHRGLGFSLLGPRCGLGSPLLPPLVMKVARHAPHDGRGLPRAGGRVLHRLGDPESGILLRRDGAHGRRLLTGRARARGLPARHVVPQNLCAR